MSKGRYRLLANDGSPRFQTDDLRDAARQAESLLGVEDGPIGIKDYHSGDILVLEHDQAVALRWLLEADEYQLKGRREIG